MNGCRLPNSHAGFPENDLEYGGTRKLELLGGKFKITTFTSRSCLDYFSLVLLIYLVPPRHRLSESRGGPFRPLPRRPRRIRRVRHRRRPRRPWVTSARLPCTPSGMNCIKICLPGKLIFSKRKGSPIILKIVSENRFCGKTYFYTIAFRALPLLSKTRLYFLSSAQIGKESTLLYVDIEDTGGAPATGDQERKRERERG